MARQETNEQFQLTSFLDGANAVYIEQLYARYQEDPSSVNPEWQTFFKALEDNPEDVKKAAKGASWRRGNWPLAESGDLVSALDGNWATVEKAVEKKVKAKAEETGKGISDAEVLQATRDSVRAIMMIRAYRMRGHLHAQLDPLGIAAPVEDFNELSPAAYGFTEADYGRKIFIDNVLGLEYATIPQMLDILKRTYCSTLGVEFMHISNPEEKSWIQERIEGPDKGVAFTKEGKKAILAKLIEAEGYEQFLDVKFKGTKRFGLDGGESLIPALEQIIKRGGQEGLEEIILGMAHRGRLNVLTNVMGKPHRAVFHEFKGGSFKPDEVEGSGDVKYHLGASSDRTFDGNDVHLSLVANPSHLEIVNPVVMGKARAKQDLRAKNWDGDIVTLKERSKVLPLLLHGDAAFAGQGVVAEILGLSGLRGHRVAGTMHFIINNQIGFTTNPAYSRSSPYPSDVAKMIEAPIFHVNGDDPEAVVFAAKVATEFRMKFHKPVVVDMFCYRRFGHNEGDEPSFTQPKMYKVIRAHKTVSTIYSERLIAEGVITQADFDAMKAEWRNHLEAEFEAGQAYKPNKADWLDGEWSGLRAADTSDESRRGKTAVPMKTLKEIGRKLSEIPEGFEAHKTIRRFMDGRAQMIETGEGLDWAMAEALAFGTLVTEGHKVRLSGQDCERGTFSQRHSVLYDQNSEARYVPLSNLAVGQAKYEVINSMLSEEAVLGFEYGYSLARPNALTMWEAQFGDFANGAQVVFDQFISSGERKWLRMSGLVCLLPHGYEGQGPEHSSARLERFLQLCAEDNMQVANCTTPANYFHILRRQVRRDFRKPLILMTPKSLLRHKRAVSSLADLAGESNFHRLLWDDAEFQKDGPIKLVKDAKIRRVVMCTGKVYYDLLEEREKRGIDDVYLLRVEQLYPFPAKALINILSRFRNAEMVWCQEEPKNMGAWSFIDPYLEWVLAHIDAKYQKVRYTGRPAAASPATGLMSKHLAQLAAFLEDALGG
ncbi:2-oxoglutarate dehydrogenase E1 component [Allorhizobium borbori]|uniref:2-oxoglutarate dehydrogenase E1 component n=1 Tax=Allorhizobium borbori TaxID=485907 RepID=A0A7W6K4F9_9HYPH|nr:2-oxoglutarate dehydrogenase E1 component [Allorhizobium borbori]MBB4103910.1 2-oxoglutarate dehydrogenase E1 component [Allorhizobium borbori]PZU23019.1 MAG: 2-oxoglutarate dehydrogenase E1 component [Shinella sp.]